MTKPPICSSVKTTRRAGMLSHQHCASARLKRPLLIAALVFLAGTALLRAAEYPAPLAADYSIHDFRFQTGEALPEVRMHYYTLGTPRRDAQGLIRNAVL